jgi:hypothetical protein
MVKTKNITVLAILALSACSAGMEESRPVPVDLSKAKPGESRLDVVSTFGAPAGQISTSTGSCDIYSMYTTGLGSFGKGVVTGGEVLSDVATLGLAEVIWTPVQSATRPTKHTVLFCYDKKDRLVSISNKNPT